MKKIFDPTMIRFIIVGLINTAVGASIMFFAYNVLDLSYWVSSAANYVVGSVVSYFLNKNFTFQNTEKGGGFVLKFIVNIAVCWSVAYGLAQPLVLLTIGEVVTDPKWQDNIAMLVGMVLFTSFNYFGQRFYVFKKKIKEN